MKFPPLSSCNYFVQVQDDVCDRCVGCQFSDRNSGISAGSAHRQELFRALFVAPVHCKLFVKRVSKDLLFPLVRSTSSGEPKGESQAFRGGGGTFLDGAFRQFPCSFDENWIVEQ